MTYQFDFDDDEVWDTGWCLEMGETVDVAVWVDDYDVAANMLGSGFYFDFQVTPNVQVNLGSSYIYDIDHGGPWLNGPNQLFEDEGGGTRWELMGINWWGVASPLLMARLRWPLYRWKGLQRVMFRL